VTAVSLTPHVIADAVARAHVAMATLEQELNAADAKLGDGDTGGMLARVIARMMEQKLTGVDDVGAALGALARAAAMATGSSLGTLLATGLLAMSREARGKSAIPLESLAGLLTLALEAMTARGGAKLGDKTVLDSLDAVIQSLVDTKSSSEAADAVVRATERALDEFRQSPNRVGRARIFGDATIGLDDPGMLAFARLARAMMHVS